MRNELLTIGAFSMLAGLSISTLRHYDDIGLLEPVDVDPQTSYRRYGYNQVDLARRIRLMRAAEMPTDQIARVLEANDDDRRVLLEQQRAALRDRASRAEHVLDELLNSGKGNIAEMATATDFRIATLNIGVDSEDALAAVSAFWSALFETELADWGHGGRQVVLGTGDAVGFFNIRVRASDEPQFGHRAAFGLGVVGLDEVHHRALDAGATEVYPPTDDDLNWPRHSLITDPVGNRAVLWESSS